MLSGAALKPLTLDEIIAAVEGNCDRSMSLGSVAGVSTDSRAAKPGDLFFAICGERFDGHDFVDQAFTAGATAAVVRDDFDLTAGGRSRDSKLTGDAVLIRVDDPIKAMGRLARYYRRSVMGKALTVVAVTGSNGKTTTKAMIAQVLEARWKGRASIKSYNNAIGVPLTLLATEPSDEFVICEVGTNAPGEVAELAGIIEPEIGVITGVSEAHLAGLGSLENIATEKLSLLRHLQTDGCAVVNVDYEILRWTLERDIQLSKVKSVTFGRWPDADLRLTALDSKSTSVSNTADGSLPTYLEFTVNDRFNYRLNVLGRHNAFNALAAIGVARRFGMDHEEIAERLLSFKLPKMRLSAERTGSLTIINDAYNANPASLVAAVDVLMDTPARGRRVLIVGDMRELGRDSEQLHIESAEYIAQSGVDLVIAVGENARLIAKTIKSVSEDLTETHAYASTKLAKRRLISHLQADDTVLVKGSRALALEVLVETMRDWAAANPGRHLHGFQTPGEAVA